MEKKTHILDSHSPSQRPNVRSATERRLAKDGTSWSSTEQRRRNRMMRQFCKSGRKGVNISSGNSEEFRNNFDLIDWTKG